MDLIFSLYWSFWKWPDIWMDKIPWAICSPIFEVCLGQFVNCYYHDEMQFSAKRWQTEYWTQSGRSFLNIRKRMGPRTLPRGTSDVILASMLVAINHYLLWAVAKETLNPYESMSTNTIIIGFFPAVLDGTLSNSLAKSRNITSVRVLSSTPLVMSFKVEVGCHIIFVFWHHVIA